MGFSFHSEQWLPHPVEAVFAFFADPENLRCAYACLAESAHREGDHRSAAAARSHTQARRSSPPASARASLSASFPFATLRSAFAGKRRSPTSAGTATSSTARSAAHSPTGTTRHRVRAIDREGLNVTLIVDHIDYELPFGVLGKLAHSLFLAAQIEQSSPSVRAKSRGSFRRSSRKAPNHISTKSANPAATAYRSAIRRLSIAAR